MTGIAQSIRDNVVYTSGWFHGRFPSSFSQLYGETVAKLTSFLSIPLPLLSFIALPIFGGSPATFSLGVFYLFWTTTVFTQGPLTIELRGTLAIRVFCFLLPALGSLAFDCAIPKLSRRMKARGREHLPGRLGRNKLLWIAFVSTGNVLLAVLLQGVLEVLFTKILHLRSLLKITSFLPLPWTIVTDIFKGLIVRGIIHYTVHRFLLHNHDSILKSWHLGWQHSVDLPFSVVAAYDHPVTYLLAVWLPNFSPAFLFRWHVLTWHLFTLIVSLEELFIYSGYAVLPSTIMLTGMARRMETHFESAGSGKAVNFGHLGLMDFLLGTTADDEEDVMDDVGEEAEKHQLQERVQDGVDSTLSKLDSKRKAGKRK